MNVEFAGAAKAKQLREYFARYGRIYIVVNATDDAVIVPEHLHGDPALQLVLNARMPQTILIKNDVLESDFSFSGNSFHCFIPMQAIWAAYVPEQQIENGIVWKEDVPETMQAVLREVRNVQDESSEPEVKINSDMPVLDVKDETQAAGRRVGHLRVIK